MGEPHQRGSTAGEVLIMTCRICRFGAELDDIVLRGETGWCICLRCYGRETDSARAMPKPLRQQLIALLAEHAAAPSQFSAFSS